MKKRQMLLAVILMLSLAFAFAPGSFAKKKAPKLNKTKVTLQVGKNTTLKVKNTKKKVTWKSSNKSVATVSKKGVVKAKKEGTATITAKVAGKSLKCKVTVKAKTPVTPTSKTLKYVGSLPFEKKLKEKYAGSYTYTQIEEMGYKDVDGQYWYDNEVYVDIPVKFTKASVDAKTSDTKIGTYNGVTRYNIEMAGTAVMPTQGYIWKYYTNTNKKEKVTVALPQDAGSQLIQNQLKDMIVNRLAVQLGYHSSGKSWDDGYYKMNNLGDTDPNFTGYVSACTFDTAGNFTYKVYDVSILDIYDNFWIDTVEFYTNPDTDRYIY